MKTNGLELNVNDLIDEVIRLTEEKMRAEARVDRQQGQIDAMNDKMGDIIRTREAAIDFIYEQSDEMRVNWENYRKNMGV